MKKTASLVLILTVHTLCATDATAQRVDNSAVYAASAKFRAVVVEFEDLVKNVRGIERREERIVDKFEEATKRVQLYARNPRQTTRLKAEYQQMMELQAKAEKAIFATYTPHHDLIRSWQQVLWYQDLLEQEFAFHFEYPRHGDRVRRRTAN